MGPREAGSGAVGPSRAESGRLGLSGVGEGLDMHWEILYFTVRGRRGWACIGIQLNYSKTRPCMGPVPAVGPSRAG